MSFETAITIILTALAILLAVLGLGIAVVAIWGYKGIRDSVREMAEKRVDEALTRKLKEYPDSADMFDVLRRLRAVADLQDQLRNQAVTTPEPKSVETASKTGVEVHVPVAETPLESVNQQVTQIEKYPGEEDENASGDGQSG